MVTKTAITLAAIRATAFDCRLRHARQRRVMPPVCQLSSNALMPAEALLSGVTGQSRVTTTFWSGRIFMVPLWAAMNFTKASAAGRRRCCGKDSVPPLGPASILATPPGSTASGLDEDDLEQMLDFIQQLGEAVHQLGGKTVDLFARLAVDDRRR